jgi:hypothetical protein
VFRKAIDFVSCYIAEAVYGVQKFLGGDFWVFEL